MKTSTRRYARRQLTWMRKLPGVDADRRHRPHGRTTSRERCWTCWNDARVRFEKWQALGNDYVIVEEAVTPELVRERLRPPLRRRRRRRAPARAARRARLRRPPAHLQPGRLGGRAVRQRRPPGDPLPAPPRLDRRRHVLDPDHRGRDPARPSPARPPAGSTWAARASPRRTTRAGRPTAAASSRAATSSTSRSATRSARSASPTRDELEELDLQKLGPLIEHAPQFPNRTNTSFWTELDADHHPRAHLRARRRRDAVVRHRRVRRGRRARAARRRLARHRACSTAASSRSTSTSRCTSTSPAGPCRSSRASSSDRMRRPPRFTRPADRRAAHPAVASRP